MNLLLVEDERKLSTLLKQLLEDERYAVDVALDGERAQELAETARYDAIILDLMIPKKDGLEVCRWLRQNRIQTPVIMLTARNQIHDRVAGLDAGADDYLPKPQTAERVWDYNFEGTTNRVAVYISYLRDKIDEGRSPKLIQTVYGVGYRLSG